MAENQARAGVQSTARPSQSQVRPVWFAISALLVLTWVAAWLFDLGEGVVLAASAAMVVLALVASRIRPAPGQEQRDAAQNALHSQPASDATSGLFSSSGKDSAEEAATAMGGRRWSLDVFAAIDAQRFAAVCETWFSWAGFDTRTQSHRNDGGVDIWLHAARLPGPVAIVRCKHWLHKPVGLQEMKEFLGVVANFKSAHGTYTTTSTYTPEALQFARENGIDAVDGRGLLRRIQTRTRQRQQALLAVAYNGQG